MVSARASRYAKSGTLAASCLAIGLATLYGTIVNIALPDMQDSLSMSITEVSWVLNIYALTLTMFMLPAGKFSDVWGRRRTFIAGCAVFGGASVG